ncbi:aminotransferase class I/II-fold pyridoxal phosphate-dependent enzyme [Bifidobacterium sp. SO1]|uniref:MalY/PatB family protein n=1 Tax=Bifidobacterium sp. SO1 TaxID=2809029 RepID=UPI001BDBD7C9|nr:aminotransferase class I/II-fold pyridoxal phosphate-dependent enzyme [Bifidobacterium sp. SO1]MBT1161902.1 aminotransferase class I/II-fold pyridoxal phosphate-dependent enzyme [Bifidobacterium sp. SO1]
MDYIKDIIGFDAQAIDQKTADELARGGSDKWSRYPGCVGAFIAEMDFGLAPCIQRAIDQAVSECALGYIPSPWKRQVAKACADWQRNRYRWNVDAAQVRVVPDVVEAFEIFLREIVGHGGSVIVPTPAYMPFLSLPRLYDVDCIEIPMLRDDAAEDWKFDFAAIEDAFRAGCHAFVLCNPHNPIGKVCTTDEMLRISELAERYDVRVFSDEIHAPFVFDGYRHVPFAAIDETTARQAFTATSASKSFNIPGTKCAQVILTNPDDVAMWDARCEWSEHQTATIGAIASTAAYEEGGLWFDEVLKYVKRNAALVDERMHGQFPGVGYVRPQGTYIAWLDFNGLGIADPARYFLEKAGVALTDGRECGAAGAGCVRMNFAMPYPLLERCLDQMAAALQADGLLPATGSLSRADLRDAA